MKRKLPTNFNPYGPPAFYQTPPKQHDINLIEEKSEIISYGYVLEETDTHRTVIQFENDYGGCYYESDSPSVECKIVTYRKEPVPNAQYEKALEKFNKAKELYDKKLAEWYEYKKVYDAQQAEKALKAKNTRQAKEKALYLRLKKKYDKDAFEKAVLEATKDNFCPGVPK